MLLGKGVEIFKLCRLQETAIVGQNIYETDVRQLRKCEIYACLEKSYTAPPMEFLSASLHP